jgi:thiol-disulfide isomerase/thioredoxin
MSKKISANRLISVLITLPATVIVGLLIWYFGLGATSPSFFKKYSTDISAGFEANRLDGSIFSLKHDGNKLVLINFWATWCEPCMREFPSLIKLADQMKDNLVIIAIAEESSSSEIAKFLKAFDSRRPNVEFVTDPMNQIGHGFGTNQFPESYIYNRKLALVKKVVGMTDWVSPDVVQYLKSL